MCSFPTGAKVKSRTVFNNAINVFFSLLSVSTMLVENIKISKTLHFLVVLKLKQTALMGCQYQHRPEFNLRLRPLFWTIMKQNVNVKKKREISFAVLISLIRNVDIGQKPKSWECKIPYFFPFQTDIFFHSRYLLYSQLQVKLILGITFFHCSHQEDNRSFCVSPPSAITVRPVCHSQISLWQTGSDCLIQIHNRDSRHTFSEPPN